MTLAQACTQAVVHSDGTAGHLLLRELGGPQELTRNLRRRPGDTVTRMDRFEPGITEAAPGDLRDTTSARAIGTGYRQIVLGDVLPPREWRLRHGQRHRCRPAPTHGGQLSRNPAIGWFGSYALMPA